ncbi:5'-3' exoribonuclease 2 homolog isoform X1 [Daphnia pulex]|uniref:5'-3' exoribonuclease 2 homolog isoform X1 n=1 Tax=Daphnia pulex TaxID=6669 RepID=UPI001EDD86B4|nr:5'-3' exoribonuclease 2 homolog isoform X1 [Daphnia pulex]
MGVPAFFRWLTVKYPSVICDCIEEKVRHGPDGKALPVDVSKPNPNGVEFDNLYLDMNGIIHPCTHPEDRPAPRNEDEMMVAIFECIDRMFAIVRPRKLLYMAIDGVAPRAKMNQQRSRRFRASKEIAEKVMTIATVRESLMARGAYVPSEKSKGEHFDSNCITPGTPFMHRLSACLHYYVHDRLRNDPGWKNVSVILSDANVPGEGEHKIMDYIRRQRAQPSHDPNTRHVLCGADADLIMLGLATHEPNFTIIREEFKPNKPRPCEICNQIGHDLNDCQGAERTKYGENDEIGPNIAAEQNYIFVRLYVLREYLERELRMPNLPFEYDLERAIDDWVFMCFFVGNDFLPHLPSLEIREGAIDRLVNLYKDCVYKTKGWVTDSGFVNLERVQIILSQLGHAEDEIFKKRQEDELSFRQRMRNKNKRFGRGGGSRPAHLPQGQFAPRAVGRGFSNPSITNAHQEILQGRQQAQNTEAAMKLKAMLRSATDEVEVVEKVEVTVQSGASNNEQGVKRKRDDDDEDDFSHDEVRLWEDGFKERYYESKFAVPPTDEEFRSKVALEYVRGLCWVLQYYYQGVPSWKWYFPYHYAPFASDFLDISSVITIFKKGTKPFRPLEQLMGVFPAASRSHVPQPWGELMVDPESPIIDFYPEDFKIDLNGKKFAWQGVALLPFVDEKRLKKAVKSLFDELTEDEKRRNVLGENQIFVGKHHKGYDFLRGLAGEVANSADEEFVAFKMESSYFSGISGLVFASEKCVVAGETLESPVQGLEPIYDCHVVCLNYRDPMPDDINFKYPACRLEGAIVPKPELKPQDFDESNSGPWRPQIGMSRSNQRGQLHTAGHRMLGHHSRPRPYTPAPFPPRGGQGPRPMGGPMSSAAAYFDSSDQHQMSRRDHQGDYSGRGRGGHDDRNRSNDGGRSSWGGGGGGNAYAPPNDYHRQQQHGRGGGGGGYGYDQPNRFSGPPATSNVRGGGVGNHYGGFQQGPPQRPPPPRQGNPPGSSGYGYYTSGYQGKRF